MNQIVPLTTPGIALAVQAMAAVPLWLTYGFTLAQLAQRLQSALEKGETVLSVCDQNNAPHGLAWACTQQGFGRPYLRLLVTQPGYEGQGIGSALLKGFESAMPVPKRGYFLLVAADNHQAQSFYQKHQYCQVGMLPSFVCARKDELIFFKSSP